MKVLFVEISPFREKESFSRKGLLFALKYNPRKTELKPCTAPHWDKIKYRNRTENLQGGGFDDRYSDKTDHGQNGPDKTDNVSGQNGPRLRTKRTTFQDKTGQASGQNGLGFWTKRTKQAGSFKKIHDVLQKSEESSQYA